MKPVMITALKKSMKSEPTSGITKNAFTDGPLTAVNACMLAMALGVAPMPKPQWPAAMTAAS